MRLSSALISPWGLMLTLLLPGSGAQRNDGPHDVPEPQTFLRRMGGRSIVMGDYIYFDGGSLSELGQDALLNTGSFLAIIRPVKTRRK